MGLLGDICIIHKFFHFVSGTSWKKIKMGKKEKKKWIPA